MERVKAIKITKEEFKALQDFCDMWYGYEEFCDLPFDEFVEGILNEKLLDFDIIIEEGGNPCP